METKNIAIACVYFVPQGNEWILDLQLKMIERFSKDVNFTIFAANVRLNNDSLSILEANPNVVFVDIPETELSSSEEHCYYLTRLVKHIAKLDFDLIATLDVDSFPMAYNWAERVEIELNKTHDVVAVSREENGDTYLLHPCFTAFKADFFKQNPFDFYPEANAFESSQFKSFLMSTNQRIDSGIGLSQLVWEKDISWLPLLRTNTVNEHHLMAGVYGDLIFHLGATSRKPQFASDLKNSRLENVYKMINKAPLLSKATKLIDNFLIKKNVKAQNTINTKLKRSPIEFIQNLMS